MTMEFTILNRIILSFLISFHLARYKGVEIKSDRENVFLEKIFLKMDTHLIFTTVS